MTLQLVAPVFKRRRRCLECLRSWPTTERLDLVKFTKEAQRAGVTLNDLGLGDESE